MSKIIRFQYNLFDQPRTIANKKKVLSWAEKLVKSFFLSVYLLDMYRQIKIVPVTFYL